MSTIAEFTTLAVADTAEFSRKTKFCGVGIQGGLGGFWALGCGFGLYTDISGGLVYGRAKTRGRFLNLAVIGGSLVDLEVQTRNKQWVTRPNVDFAIGLDWDYRWDCYLISLNLGWEYHHYFEQNFLRAAEINSDRGDLSLHGLTAGINFQF